MGPYRRKGIPAKPKLIFMGTPEFALPTLKALIDHGHDLRAVVTQPDRPKGRGRILAPPPVKQMAMNHGIEVLEPEKASAPVFCDRLKKREPDLIIVVAFGQILHSALLELPGWGAVNIHASLLPKYRGAAPIQWAIRNDEPKTGLTLMRMERSLDTGPILFQTETPILSDETAGKLHGRLADLAGVMIVEALTAMTAGDIREKPQDNAAATYAPKMERSECVINWNQEAGKISALIRALDPRPGAVTGLGAMFTLGGKGQAASRTYCRCVQGTGEGHFEVYCTGARECDRRSHTDRRRRAVGRADGQARFIPRRGLGNRVDDIDRGRVF